MDHCFDVMDQVSPGLSSVEENNNKQTITLVPF